MSRFAQLSIVGIGPQKTATTWLAQVLDGSNGICLPAQVKETFFWDRNFTKGEGWYFRHFSGEGQKTEMAPTYFSAPEAVARLHAHNPQLKILTTLRDPADRAYSLYLHHFRKGRTRKGFRDAIADFPEILEASHYSTYLPMWLNAFGPAQVLVLLQDDIEHAPEAVLSQLGAFLDVDISAKHVDVRQRVNAGGQPRSQNLAALSTKIAETLRALGLYRVINFAKALRLKKYIYGVSGATLPPLNQADRAWLVSMFEEDIGYVENLLSVTLEKWRRVN